MTDDTINPTNSQKMSVYCKTCVCKSCEQVACLEQKNAELKAENERLKAEINKLGKKHEDYCNTMYWQMEEQMDKYRQTLQEIKAIAEKTGCRAITDLITKAEEE